MKTIPIQLYRFSELPAAAQSRVVSREAAFAGECFDGDSTIEDFKRVAALLNFTLTTQSVTFAGGRTVGLPIICWSGFGSQGDGASFEATWSAVDMQADAIKQYAPKDTELHRIAAGLAAVAKKHPTAWLRCRKEGYSAHSGDMVFDFEAVPDDAAEEAQPAPDQEALDRAQNTLASLARRLADWLYRQLETAYEFETSEANVRERLLEGPEECYLINGDVFTAPETKEP